jgi:hypothetical protein
LSEHLALLTTASQARHGPRLALLVAENSYQEIHFCGTNSSLRKYIIQTMSGVRPTLGWCYALAILLALTGVQSCLFAQRAAKLSPKVMEVVNGPLLELKDDDPPLLRLKKERFNAALKEAKARFDLYSRGLTRLPELIDVGERLFAAELDLYDQSDQKEKALQRQLDVYTEAETNLEKQVKDGLATEADLERLRCNKLSVQIELYKAKNSRNGVQSKAQATPE